MNILHISRTMGQGGAEKVVYQLCKESRHNVFVVSIGGVYEQELIKIGVKHYLIPDIDNKNPFLILKTLIILWRIIKKEKIDIVHTHHRMAAFYSRLLNILNRKFRRIYTAHNVFFDKKKLLRFALKGSMVVAVGEGVKQNLISIFDLKSDNIEVIYNSIEVPDRIRLPLDNFILKKKDKLFIATIGRLSEQKGIDVFLKALAPIILNNKKVFGIVIGDGNLKDNLIELSKSLKINNNIIFLGYRSDIFELISCMDFVVLASRWEGFPLTPIETFSMKKTIIASNIDGNNEIVIDNYNGILFQKDNVEELSTKISILCKNEYLRNRLANNSYSYYKENFSYDKFIKHYEELYLKVGD